MKWYVVRWKVMANLENGGGSGRDLFEGILTLTGKDWEKPRKPRVGIFDTWVGLEMGAELITAVLTCSVNVHSSGTGFGGRPALHWIGVWLGPRADLDKVAKTENSAPAPAGNRTSTIHPLTSTETVSFGCYVYPLCVSVYVSHMM
jgi:hypothetical protein